MISKERGRFLHANFRAPRHRQPGERRAQRSAVAEPLSIVGPAIRLNLASIGCQRSRREGKEDRPEQEPGCPEHEIPAEPVWVSIL